MANVAHQAFASLAPVSSSSYSLSIQVPAFFPSPAPPFSPSPSLTSVPSPSPVLSQLPIQPPTQSPAHLIFLHNTIKIHLISEINNPMLLSIIKICTLLSNSTWLEELPKRPYKCFNCGLRHHTAWKCFLSKAPAGEIAFCEFLNSTIVWRMES